jgi:hypothetical protein
MDNDLYAKSRADFAAKPKQGGSTTLKTDEIKPQSSREKYALYMDSLGEK